LPELLLSAGAFLFRSQGPFLGSVRLGQQSRQLVDGEAPRLAAGEEFSEIFRSSSYGKLASRTSCVARCSRCHCLVMPVAMIARTAASAVFEAMYTDVRIML
jgi:hypothetical protein